MPHRIRTTVAIATVVLVGGLGPAPAEAAVPGSDPVPTLIPGKPSGWWCRLTHLC
jgi:hypothetical protein